MPADVSAVADATVTTVERSVFGDAERSVAGGRTLIRCAHGGEANRGQSCGMCAEKQHISEASVGRLPLDYRLVRTRLKSSSSVAIDKQLRVPMQRVT